MPPGRRSLLLFVMLCAIGIRSVLGAPCCMDVLEAAHSAHAEHGHHAHHGGDKGHLDQGHNGHSDHGDDPTAQPCCSACGPTLPQDPVLLAEVKQPRILPEPAPIRALKTRPPFPAYNATGPPQIV